MMKLVRAPTPAASPSDAQLLAELRQFASSSKSGSLMFRRESILALLAAKDEVQARSFAAGERAAFIAAVEECQAFAEGLSDLQRRMGSGEPGGVLSAAFATQIEDKVSAAQQIAVRIAQRARRL